MPYRLDDPARVCVKLARIRSLMWLGIWLAIKFHQVSSNRAIQSSATGSSAKDGRGDLCGEPLRTVQGSTRFAIELSLSRLRSHSEHPSKILCIWNTELSVSKSKVWSLQSLGSAQRTCGIREHTNDKNKIKSRSQITIKNWAIKNMNQTITLWRFRDAILVSAFCEVPSELRLGIPTRISAKHRPIN